MSENLLAETLAMFEARLTALEILMVAERGAVDPQDAERFSQRLGEVASAMARAERTQADGDADQLLAAYRTVAFERLAALAVAVANSGAPGTEPNPRPH